MADIFALLTDAIQNKKQVVATYDGLLREMCPHVLGYKDGTPRCLFYQFDGESSWSIFPLDSPQAYQNWRCLFLNELTDVSLRDGPWHSISRHTKPQKCVDTVVAEVAGWV